MITVEQAFKIGYQFQINLETYAPEYQNGELWASTILKGKHGIDGLADHPQRKEIKKAIYNGTLAAGRRTEEIAMRHKVGAERAIVEAVATRLADTEIAMATPHEMASQINTDNWYEGVHSVLQPISGADAPIIENYYTEKEIESAKNGFEMGKIEGTAILRAWLDARKSANA
jgi:hypothetical protein